MISAGDFKKGSTFEIDGDVFSIVEFQHVKPGKGSAFVRTKLKNIKTGATVEKSFSPTEKYPKAEISTREMQYLYNDGGLYYFMDPQSYEQIPLNHSQVEDTIVYIKENDNATIKFHNGEAFSVEPPLFVELLVTETEPGFKGDTSQGATKPAKVETGAQINVPLFIEEGNTIKIDTRTGEYIERV